jgi:hypothetical protein
VIDQLAELPDLRLEPGEVILRQESWMLQSWGLWAILIPFILTAALADFIFSRIDKIPSAHMSFLTFAIMGALTAIGLRVFWRSIYVLTNYRILAFSGPRGSTLSLKWLPLTEATAKVIQRGGLKIVPMQGATLTLRMIGWKNAFEFAYAINRLSAQTNLKPAKGPA